MKPLLSLLPAAEHTQWGHPENAGRVQGIVDLLDRQGILSAVDLIEPFPASLEQLRRIHCEDMIEQVRRVCLRGGGRLDADTYATLSSYDLARQAAGAACAIVDAICLGKAINGMAIIRPPGHHAEWDRVGGFCLFNNVAAAVRQAQQVHGIRKVLIIDFDVHHGNGTQAIFFEDPSVLFISLHLYHPFFYPGTGAMTEIGSGAGEGMTVNIPFMPGVGDQGYSDAFTQLVRPIAAKFQPELILVSAGFDAHWIDPLAAAALSLAGFSQISRMIAMMAEEMCASRVLFVLEGGYHFDALSYGVLNTVYALMGHDEIVDPLGPSPDREANASHLLKKLRALHLPE